MTFSDSPYVWLIESELFRTNVALLIDSSGNIIDENGVAVEKLKITTTLVGQSILDLMPPAFQQHHKKWIAQFFAKPTGYIQQLPTATNVKLENGDEQQFYVNVIKVTSKLTPTAVVLMQPPEQKYSFIEHLLLNEARFEAVLEHFPVPTALNDEQGNITYLNKSFRSLFGYTLDDIPTLEQWWPKAYPDSEYRKEVQHNWLQRMESADKNESAFEPYEVIVNAKCGKEVIVLASASPLEVDYRHEHMVTLQDITEIRKAEKNLRFQNNVLHHLREGVHLVSLDSKKIVYANERLCELFGYSSNEMVNLDVSKLNGGTPEQQISLAEEIISQLKTRGSWEGDILNRKKDGTEFWCYANVMETEHPTYGRCWVSIHQDISEQKQFHQLLWRQAHYDALTNLPNRRLLQENMDSEISLCSRNQMSFALLFLDIDDFKDVNDLFGHQTGDALLIEIASRLEQSVRTTDIVTRFGGDEFVILVRNINPERPNELQMLAEKISAAIAAPFYVQPETIQITVSIGLAIYPLDSNDSEELLSYSDQALHESKAQGRNRICFFTDKLQHQALQNRKLVSGLKKAIKEKQLEVYYQPIVETKTRICRKAEALLRWKLGDQYVSPVEFIPIAEETGLIHEIGQFVFEQVLHDAKILSAKGFESIQISLNKSVLQMNSNRIATEKIWPYLVKQNDLSCEQFCIELTESSVLETTELTQQKFETLQQSGFKFAMDDFGTGYTSLNHLAQFQFQITKIDRCFITGIENDVRKRDLTAGMIALSHKLRMEVVAEGIETQVQFDLLKQFDCDYIQGYLIAKPMPLRSFLDWLTANTSQNEQ